METQIDEKKQIRKQNASNEESIKKKSKQSDETNGNESSSIVYTLVEEQRSKFKRFAACRNSQPLSVKDWTEQVLHDEDEIETFVNYINEQSQEFKAYFFETKGVSNETCNKDFEFVLVNSEQLYKFGKYGADLDAFEEHFDPEENRTCTFFPNLSGSSTLIIPEPIQDDTDVYAHLANFLRMASDIEICDFWQLVGKQYTQAIQKEKTVWLSTSGLGVAYLHMRIDHRPKYYTYDPFRNEF